MFPISMLAFQIYFLIRRPWTTRFFSIFSCEPVFVKHLKLITILHKKTRFMVNCDLIFDMFFNKNESKRCIRFNLTNHDVQKPNYVLAK